MYGRTHFLEVGDNPIYGAFDSKKAGSGILRSYYCRYKIKTNVAQQVQAAWGYGNSSLATFVLKLTIDLSSINLRKF